MRIFLDECVDRRLAQNIAGHQDVFVTTDRNLSFQQDLPAFDIAVIVLRGRSDRLADLWIDTSESSGTRQRCRP